MQTPQRLPAGDRGGQIIAGGAFLSLIVIFLGELATPSEVVLASLAVVPVAAAAWFAEFAYRPLLMFAVAMSALGAAVGSISAESAAAACAACVAMTLLVRAARRSGAAGRTVAPPDGSGTFATVRARTPAGPGEHSRERRLTAREREVVDLAAAGLTAREIGARLFIGVRTVETHLANSYAKLGVASKRELMQRSYRNVG